MRDALLGRHGSDNGRQGEIDEQRAHPAVGAVVRKPEGSPVPFGRVHPPALAFGRASQDEQALERSCHFERERQRQAASAKVADADRVNELRPVLQYQERPPQAQGMIRDRLAVGGREVVVGQPDLSRNPLSVEGHQQQRRCPVQPQHVVREIACVAIEQAEPGDVLDDRSVLAGENREIIRLQHKGMADVDR